MLCGWRAPHAPSHGAPKRGASGGRALLSVAFSSLARTRLRSSEQLVRQLQSSDGGGSRCLKGGSCSQVRLGSWCPSFEPLAAR